MEAMYALVRTGGKQYRVSKDDTILVERIAADEGAEVILDDVVMLGDGDKVTIGTPRVDGAAVSATVMRQTRGPKIIIFRRKRRKNHRRTQGHRQDLTLLKINHCRGRQVACRQGGTEKGCRQESRGRAKDSCCQEGRTKGGSKGSAGKEGSCEKGSGEKGDGKESRRKEILGSRRNLARPARRQLKGAGYGT